MLLSTPARAYLTRTELARVGVVPPPGAALPSSLRLRGMSGRMTTVGVALAGTPALLLFSDFACKSMCGPILTMTSAALAKSGLTPARDFHLIVIDLRANATAAGARAFVGPQLAEKIAGATRVLMGNSTEIAAATKALGYRYIYDAEHDQYAHPTAAFVLDASGKLSAVLSAPGLQGIDVRLALLGAGTRASMTFADRLRLLCYCYDPATGIYSAAIWRMVDAAAAASALALGGWIFLLRRLERTRRRG